MIFKYICLIFALTNQLYAYTHIQIDPIRPKPLSNEFFNSFDQWAFLNTGKPDSRGKPGKIGADLHLSSLWQKGMNGSKKIVVAMIDTGMDINHEALKDNLYTNPLEISNNGIDDDKNGFIDDIHGWNFSDIDPIKNPNGTNNVLDEYNHGTHVAGIIGATGKGQFGIRGVNNEITLLPIRFTNASGGGSIESAILAIRYAIDMNVDIINCSWGMSEQSKELHDIFTEASNRGILIVVSAGNSSIDVDKTPIIPASYSDINNLISVSATDNEDEMAFFSNYGFNTIHVAAPGYSIVSTLNNNMYGTLSGTSMAAPMVSGVAALLKAHLGLSAEEIKKRILETVDPKVHYYYKIKSHGRVNAENAFHNIISKPIHVPHEDEWVTIKDYPVVESQHPYLSNSDIKIPLKVPGAKYMRLKFEYIETESNSDTIKIEKSNGELVQMFTGFLNYITSDYLEGDEIIIHLQSDSALNAKGFKISQVQAIQ